MDTLIYSILLAFVVSLVLGPIVIPLLHKLKFGQQVRDDGPKQHLKKSGTPTMGGIMMLLAMAVPLAVFCGGSMEFLFMAVVGTAGFGLIGFLDDFLKIRHKRSLGLRGYQKIIGQLGVSLVLALWAYHEPLVGSTLYIPFFDVSWELGWFYVPFMVFVIIAVVNSVNLTDGLDGLASGVTLIDAITYAFIFYVLAASAGASGDVMLQSNLQNGVVFAGALAGACLGFLRFNAYPARVFMGDTGSLALGGALSVMAMATRTALIVPFVGVMFVASSVSVILQVGSYKLRNKKRVFRMAPLHHHFELKGYPETKIVSMYMIITAAMCLLVLLAFV